MTMFNSTPTTPPLVHDMVRVCRNNTALAATLMISAKSDNPVVLDLLEKLTMAAQMAHGEDVVDLKLALEKQLEERRKFMEEERKLYLTDYGVAPRIPNPIFGVLKNMGV